MVASANTSASQRLLWEPQQLVTHIHSTVVRIQRGLLHTLLNAMAITELDIMVVTINGGKHDLARALFCWYYCRFYKATD